MTNANSYAWTLPLPEPDIAGEVTLESCELRCAEKQRLFRHRLARSAQWMTQSPTISAPHWSTREGRFRVRWRGRASRHEPQHIALPYEQAQCSVGKASHTLKWSFGAGGSLAFAPHVREPLLWQPITLCGAVYLCGGWFPSRHPREPHGRSVVTLQSASIPTGRERVGVHRPANVACPSASGR